jgi:hypothetical protein
MDARPAIAANITRPSPTHLLLCCAGEVLHRRPGSNPAARGCVHREALGQADADAAERRAKTVSGREAMAPVTAASVPAAAHPTAPPHTHLLKYVITRDTCVCCSMISDTQT